jgi:hypothetical protein
MEESDTYLMIREEGEAMAGRSIILMLGEDRLGPPDESVETAVQSITDLDRLTRMLRHTIKVANWQEILDTP